MGRCPWINSVSQDQDLREANYEDPDKIHEKAAFHQGLHCLFKKIRDMKALFFIAIMTDNLFKYKIDHFKHIYT